MNRIGASLESGRARHPAPTCLNDMRRNHSSPYPLVPTSSSIFGAAIRPAKNSTEAIIVTPSRVTSRASSGFPWGRPGGSVARQMVVGLVNSRRRDGAVVYSSLTSVPRHSPRRARLLISVSLQCVGSVDLPSFGSHQVAPVRTVRKNHSFGLASPRVSP